MSGRTGERTRGITGNIACAQGTFAALHRPTRAKVNNRLYTTIGGSEEGRTEAVGSAISGSVGLSKTARCAS